ncbi:hypothetical protein [Helicobacter didelphidarum]|uniref:hypothetical protein n=1 Tax=Helicobacter didelphidarum TaxID=2040648 RepID=UPI0011C0735C|nr:hypothetical protein [Helicobacter didelphidarum]
MSIIFLLAHVLHAKSIEYVFKNEFGTKLKPSTESFDKDSEIIGGYAKYRISVAVGTQNEMDLINDKKEEIIPIIESLVKECNGMELQATRERQLLADKITKKINAYLNQKIIKATHITNMVIAPDIVFKP